MKKSGLSVFLNGLIKENPTFVQLLGMCPTLAVTTTLFNGLGMGLSATAVLVASNVLISMLRKFVPDKVRIAAYVVIIATFVTILSEKAADDVCGLWFICIATESGQAGLVVVNGDLFNIRP